MNAFHARSRWPRGMTALFAAATIAASLAGPLAGGVAHAQVGGEFGPDVSVRLVSQKTTVRPGDQLAIAVVLEHGPGFHTWPNPEQVVVPPELGADFTPIPTLIDPASVPDGVTTYPVQWPAPRGVPVNYTGVPTDLLSFADTSVAYLPIEIALDQAAGKLSVDVTVQYQACDETLCYAPETKTLRTDLEVDPQPAGQAVPNEPELFTAFEPAGAFLAGSGAGGGASPSCSATAERVTFNVFGWTGSLNPCGPLGLILLLSAAALGGLLLNFTPCVLPVVPLKIMALSRAAGNRPRLLALGTSMSLGVVAFWLLIGGAIAFIAGFNAISALFQTGWFSLVVGAIVGIMGLGMFGLFTVRLPQAVYRMNPSQESVQGSFLFGVLTAVLSTPCTAPFMGGAAAWAATQNPAVTLGTFSAIGFGMAVPYMVLVARPGLIERVPRSGPGSALVKEVMGLAMLAVAAFFIGIPVASALNTPPDPVSRNYWWAVAFFAVLAAGWLIYRTWRITDRTLRRALVIGPAIAFGLASVAIASDLSSHGPIEWVYYTPERFDAASAEGKVILLDFTAEWCLNCKALESGVLHRPEIVELFSREDIVPMRVDMTNDNEMGKAKLSELNWYGIPLLAVYGPKIGYTEPIMYDTYTPKMVLEAVRSAGALEVALER